jgi:hypothetical protein
MKQNVLLCSGCNPSHLIAGEHKQGRNWQITQQEYRLLSRYDFRRKNNSHWYFQLKVSSVPPEFPFTVIRSRQQIAASSCRTPYLRSSCQISCIMHISWQHQGANHFIWDVVFFLSVVTILADATAQHSELMLSTSTRNWWNSGYMAYYLVLPVLLLFVPAPKPPLTCSIRPAPTLSSTETFCIHCRKASNSWGSPLPDVWGIRDDPLARDDSPVAGFGMLGK